MSRGHVRALDSYERHIEAVVHCVCTVLLMSREESCARWQLFQLDQEVAESHPPESNRRPTDYECPEARDTNQHPPGKPTKDKGFGSGE